MYAEITDDKGARPAGWIYFDAECRFCAAARRRWGRVFERRGFVWLPLQTPGTAERLALSPERLRAAMWLLPDGEPPVPGIEAWLRLMRHVGWLRPLAAVLGLPGLKALAGAAYGWVARHRHCLAGSCRLAAPPPRSRRRSRAFLDLP